MNTLKNHVQLIGHLGRDVEVKTLENGSHLARVTLATKEVYTNSNGEKVTDTQWHNLIAWGKTAENMGTLLAKGKEVAVTGKLSYSSWEDKEGVKRTSTDVVVQEFMLLS